MMSKHVRLVLHLLTCAALWSAFATDLRAEIFSRVPGEIGWRKSIPVHLILADDVVLDLGLSPEAAAELKRLHEQIQAEVETERRQLLKDAQPQQRDRWVRVDSWNDELIHAVRNRHADKLNELLTPEQQTRLYQIHLQKQRSPTDVLCDSGVAKAIGLTDAQRAQILQLYREVVKAEMDAVKMSGRYKGPSSSTLDKACPGKVLQILSEAQRQSLEALRGKPFVSSSK